MTTQRELDMVHLRLILVSGKTQDFTFSPNDSATDIAKHVFENWPAGWEEERVSSPSILRLIFQGRFLHGNVTLGALKLPPGRTTVMHLVARETLPEPNSHDRDVKQSLRCWTSFKELSYVVMKTQEPITLHGHRSAIKDHQWHLCHHPHPVCSWQWTNREKTYQEELRKHLRDVRVHEEQEQTPDEECRDGPTLRATYSQTEEDG
ncbi:Ubiquitin-like 3 [Scophthalmus maximus]|uniref:Ubiquitin-like protein 3 n=1 Tax=Scophthalmus maximus TaxID=52904 RepID=A0A2U9C870_SCOMX|nr:Ubiquitin-like 3 [Scophthalmus maximus]